MIGGTRFSGPHAVRRLSQAGHEVLLFHRGQNEPDLPEGVRHVHGNRRQLADHAAELRRFSPDVVVDMIPLCEEDARTVVEIFRGVARRVVALSSQDVYRAYGRLIGVEPGPLEPTPLREDSPLREQLYPYREQVKDPDHPLYQYDKIPVERVYRGDPQLPGTILRYPMVYGPGDAQRRLSEDLKRMDDGRPVIFLEEGLAAWRWTKGYVENAAHALVLAISDSRAAGRIYNVGEQTPLTWADWVKEIGRAAGWNGRVVVLPRERLPRELIPEQRTEQHLLSDTARIREELGYEELVGLEEGLSRTVAWEREHPPEQGEAAATDYSAEDALLKELGEEAH